MEAQVKKEQFREWNKPVFGKYQRPPNHLKYRRNKKEAEKE